MAINPYSPPVIEPKPKQPLRIPFLFELTFALIWFAAIGSAFYYRERMIEAHRASLQHVDLKAREERIEYLERYYSDILGKLPADR